MNTVNLSVVCKLFFIFPPENICVSSCRLSISRHRSIAQYHKRSSTVNVPAPSWIRTGVHWKMKCRSIRPNDRSWPIRLTDLDKYYGSCNYLWINYIHGISLFFFHKMDWAMFLHQPLQLFVRNNKATARRINWLSLYLQYYGDLM